jgi:hypothetical protein
MGYAAQGTAAAETPPPMTGDHDDSSDEGDDEGEASGSESSSSSSVSVSSEEEEEEEGGSDGDSGEIDDIGGAVGVDRNEHVGSEDTGTSLSRPFEPPQTIRRRVLPSD